MYNIVLIFVGASLFASLCQTSIQKRVIGGEEAPPDKYRWSVSIKGDIDQINASGACGASILKTKGEINWLVTAAHCFYPSGKKKIYDLTNPSLWHARVGLTKVDFIYEKHNEGYKSKSKLMNFFKKAFMKLFSSKETSSTTGDIHIKKIFIHPNYKYTRLENDIALMKLIEPLPVEELRGVNTIDLPDISSSNSWPSIDSECVVVGWGCTKAAGSPNTIAKLATLKIWENEKCKEVYTSPIDLNPKSEFCAGYLNKSYGICPGDSGSGLACHYKGNWTLAGVVSATHRKFPGQYPAIFTRVASFRKWIIRTITKN